MLSEKSGDEKLLTKGEVARLCRVDVRTVDRWLMAGKVGYHRTPSGRVLFRKRDVLKVVANGNGQSSAPAAAIVDSAPPARLPAPASE
jgi:excisionase family DNA binding protein